MTAYYNEIDPYAAQWLRNLIAAGHIADGVVDERSIEDVRPADLRGFTQCHFFAGIGVWSHALRSAGWVDDRPVWTGSCPCQPFSAAGKGAGFADERHLWPAFFHLIEQCNPPVVFGEQVASKDGLAWLDLVRADLEASGRAVGAADLCAAGVGAPHIRQRLFWVASANSYRRSAVPIAGLHDSEHHAESRSGAGGLADADIGSRGQGRPHVRGRAVGGDAQPRPGPGGIGLLGGAADTDGRHPSAERQQRGREQRQQPEDGGALQLAGASPTNGLWRAADWLLCRDGKWRPVEPGTFPLAHGAPARVGRLRAYGNAIVPQVAQAFIEAAMTCLS